MGCRLRAELGRAKFVCVFGLGLDSTPTGPLCSLWPFCYFPSFLFTVHFALRFPLISHHFSPSLLFLFSIQCKPTVISVVFPCETPSRHRDGGFSADYDPS